MKECTTHHFACDCREEKFAKAVRALRFYADQDDWRNNDRGEEFPIHNLAREALKGLENE
jgi:hypothetical protein